jgi:hypothetical protein
MQMFTNCARIKEDSQVYSTMLPQDHPGATAINAAQFIPPLGHKKFLNSIFSENFGLASDGGYTNALKYWVQYWVDNRGDQLGLACNPYESSSPYDCAGNIANSNLPILRASTPIREAIRIHLCDELLGYDQAVTGALANAGVTASKPDSDSIRALTGLFYRADLPSDDYISALVEMDQHLDLEGTSVIDRWRMLLVEICETTGWQRL